jgi:hypothetical protein
MYMNVLLLLLLSIIRTYADCQLRFCPLLIVYAYKAVSDKNSFQVPGVRQFPDVYLEPGCCVVLLLQVFILWRASSN